MGFGFGFRPGLRPSRRYSITALSLTSQSWPGFVPGMTPSRSSLWIWRVDSPVCLAAAATVMYSSSGNLSP